MRLNKRRLRRIVGDYAFLTPQLVLYVGLNIIPFLVAIPILFTNKLNFLDQGVEYVGLANFTRLFTDQALRFEFVAALGRTLRFAAMNYVMMYVFGLSLALLMFETGFKSGIFTIINLPRMVSGLAIGYIALMLFSRSSGTVNLVLRQLGVTQQPIDIKTGPGVSFILPLVCGWQDAGFNTALFLSGLMTIPTETIEAAIVDGATYWQRLTRVYLPQMVPSIVIATTFCLIGSFGVFDILVALGALSANPSVQFISVFLFNHGFGGNVGAANLALAMTLALEVGLPLIVVSIMLQRLQKRLQYY